MKRSILHWLALSACLVVVLSSQAVAQGVVDAQRTREALSNFPDSQAVLFINIQRIVNKALPRFVPQRELQKLHSEPQKLGFDIKGFEYAIVGVRFVEPAPPSGIPEFVVLVRGTFNADSLLALGRIALDSQGVKATSESYGSKTIDIVELQSLKTRAEGGEESASSTTQPPFKEIAATTLDPNTLVIGIPAYVRATIDAATKAEGRLDSQLVDLGSRDPFSLFGLMAKVPDTFPQYLRKAGVPKNDEAEEMIRGLKQISLSSGMTALDFTIRAAVHTDTAERASAISGLAKMGIAIAEAAAREEIARKRAGDAQEARLALGAIRTFTNTTQGNTVIFSFSVPQRTIAALARKNFPKSSRTGKATRATGPRKARSKAKN